MIIRNSDWKEIAEEDILIFSIGNEKRSTHIFSLCKETRNHNNTLAFAINNNKAVDTVKQEIENKEIEIAECNYSDADLVVSKIKEYIQLHDCKNKKINIDYSSMPRSWYSRIPGEICEKNGMNALMWYSAGEYPQSYNSYPNAVKAIDVFSGKAIPFPDIKRYHIMGLGFDAIRSETIRTVIEPEVLVCCCSYDPNNLEIKATVQEKNKHILQDATLIISLPINNFGGMISNLCGLVNNILSENAQAILIPDGPKPLILAMSLVPSLVNKPGVTCLHIQSNDKYYKPVDVLPKGEIWGFSINHSC